MRVARTRSKQDGREKIAALASIVDKSSAFRPAREVLKRVRAVPTIFPQIDRALRVGGWPIERISTIHGPSMEGKTSFLHGLGLSFLMRGHFYVHIDAERTTPITWMEGLFGPWVDSPLFLAYRPPTYEETVDAVRDFVTTLAEARNAGKIPPQTTALIGLDSLKALVPKDFFKRIAKGGAEEAGLDGRNNRGGQYQAFLNSAWIKELTPLLDDTMTALLLVGREYENTDGDQWSPDWVLGGGRDVLFGSSITARIERKWIYGPGSGTERKPVYGEKHAVAIRKTKVSGKEEKVVYANFHTSNGVLVPAGFDRARDVLEMAKELDIVKGDGSWFTWNRKRWHGEHQAVKILSADGALLTALEECCRARFEVEGPLVVDGDGVVKR